MDLQSAVYMGECLKWETKKCARFYPRPELEAILWPKPKLLDQCIGENVTAWR
jgi:hypothetical protein